MHNSIFIRKMKTMFVVVFSMFTLTTFAQEFRFGPTITPVSSWWIVEGDLYVTSGNSLGFQVGATIDQTLGSSERFALVTGLNFNHVKLGFEEVTGGPDTVTSLKGWTFKINSLDLPLLLKLRSDELGNTVLFAQYGLTLGFKLTENISVNDGKNGGEAFEYLGLNSSLTMGVGIEQSIADDKDLVIGLHFQNGIRNTLISNANDDNMFTQQLGIRAALLF
ncbi:MAG: outer membrane beta-barrel protein [Bacteroidetes bacterium]|nr:outer membrane beta-barrel protein [Bacteroidota bacterium]